MGKLILSPSHSRAKLESWTEEGNLFSGANLYSSEKIFAPISAEKNFNHGS